MPVAAAPQPAAPQPAAPQPAAAGQPPVPSRFVTALVQVAEQEWTFFGQQEYDIDGGLVHAGHKETQLGFAERIGQYWVEGTDTHGLSGTNDVPWSAAFISWIMKTAGAGMLFRYSTQHSRYISQAIRDRRSNRPGIGFLGYRLSECKPSVGDLVCWGREPGVDFDNQMGGNYKGHCDVVVQVDADRIWIIGGNVGDSVTKRPLRLDASGLLSGKASRGETPFAIMKDLIQNPATAGSPATAIILPTSDPGTGPITTPAAVGGAGAAAAVGGSGAAKIAWGGFVSPDFRAAVIDTSAVLGCDPSHLMAAMAFETGERFSPSIQNPRSHATGLIQFMPSTAVSLGTTTDALAKMTAVEQLDFVLLYLSPFTNRLKSVSDMYAAIIAPSAVGKPDATVLYFSPQQAYVQNAGLDVNRDGQITKGEAASKVQAQLDKGLSTQFIG